jgi:predicted dehydrogenase
MAEYGVLVHGAGWVSTEHVRAYQRNPYTEVVAICSRTRESAERLKEATGAVNAKIYTDYEQALADPNVHLVSICTPPNLHPRETILAAQAGKHILIEKAVANSREELMEMVRAVRQAGVKTVVSFVLHWNPQFMTIKRPAGAKRHRAYLLCRGGLLASHRSALPAVRVEREKERGG